MNSNSCTTIKMKTDCYYKTDMNTWKSILLTCKRHNIKLADIIIHSKYKINSERIFGFSEITPQENVNCGLILHNYDSNQMVFTSSVSNKYFTQDEWNFLLPKLQEYNLLNKPINFFYHVADPLRIIEVDTPTRKIYFYSNYYVRLVYKIQSEETPQELADLFMNNGACLNAIYVRHYHR